MFGILSLKNNILAYRINRMFKATFLCTFFIAIGSAAAASQFIKEGQPCATPNNRKGECIRFKNCDSLLRMIQKVPLYDEDITFLRASQCGYDKEPLVCCPDQLIKVAEPDEESNAKVPVETFTVLSNLLPTPEVCNVGPPKRIFGGDETTIDEYPWMALLEYSKPNNKKGFHCGGVLINDRYVVTASHCIAAPDIKKLKWVLSSVRLGEWDLNSEKDCIKDYCSDPPIDVPVEKLIVHEKYAPTAKAQENDIALIRLSLPVAYTDFISPICLPSGQRLRSKIYDEELLVVAGWGKTENVSFSNVKLKVNVPGVSLDNCSKVYQARNRIQISPTQLCAGGVAGKDSCRGDSGGPLIATDSKTSTSYYYLAGIVSFGPTPCGKEGFPGVYTRVSSFTDWIVQNIHA